MNRAVDIYVDAMTRRNDVLGEGIVDLVRVPTTWMTTTEQGRALLLGWPRLGGAFFCLFPACIRQDRWIFRGFMANGGEVGQTANFRFGSEPDIPRHSHLSPLSGAKRTLTEVSRDFAVRMSACGGKADSLAHLSACLLIAIPGPTAAPRTAWIPACHSANLPA